MGWEKQFGVNLEKSREKEIELEANAAMEGEF
jgi:hypothetical protein